MSAYNHNFNVSETDQATASHPKKTGPFARKSGSAQLESNTMQKLRNLLKTRMGQAGILITASAIGLTAIENFNTVSASNDSPRLVSLNTNELSALNRNDIPMVDGEEGKGVELSWLLDNLNDEELASLGFEDVRVQDIDLGQWQDSPTEDSDGNMSVNLDGNSDPTKLKKPIKRKTRVTWSFDKNHAPVRAVVTAPKPAKPSTNASGTTASSTTAGANNSSTFNQQSTATPPATTAVEHPWFYNLHPDDAIKVASDTTGIPEDLLHGITSIESKGNPFAFNQTRSGVRGTFACGLMQLMPRGSFTYQEMLHKYGDQLRINEIFGVETLRGTIVKRGVIKHTKIHGKLVPVYGHIFANDNAGTKAMNLCFNPYVNVMLGAMHLRDKIAASENRLNDKYGFQFDRFAYSLAYLNHFLGSRADLMRAYYTDRDSLAKTFVPRSVRRQNYGMFYDENGKARTVGGMYDHMEDVGGLQGKELSPEQFFWRRTRSDILANVQTYLVERGDQINEAKQQAALAAASKPTTMSVTYN